MWVLAFSCYLPCTFQPGAEPDTTGPHVPYTLDLESAELAGVGYTNDAVGGQNVSMRPSGFEQGPSVYEAAAAQRFKSTVRALAQEKTCTDVSFDFRTQFFI